MNFLAQLLFHSRCSEVMSSEQPLKMLALSECTPPLMGVTDGHSSHITITSPSHLKPHMTLLEGL